MAGISCTDEMPEKAGISCCFMKGLRTSNKRKKMIIPKFQGQQATTFKSNPYLLS